VDLSALARFARLSLRGGQGASRQRRLALLAAFSVCYPLLEAVNWTGLLLDDLLYRGYRSQAVHEPVFIVGCFRSGTTFLHRLLTQDRAQFTTMRLWEILFAPSITARRVWQAASAVDQQLGAPVGRLLSRWEGRWQERLTAHKISLRAPEEDEYLLLHIWSSMTIWMYGGFLEEMWPHVRFDDAVAREEQERILGFYARCVQRHVHAHGGARSQRHYLSKSPPFTGKIGALSAQFPDARFVYLVRNPVDVALSMVSFLDQSWHILGGPAGDAGAREAVLGVVEAWHTHPLERLRSIREERYCVVRFEDLVRDPAGAVARIYARFGLEVSAAYACALQVAARRSERYKSRHRYEAEEMGLARQQLEERYRGILETLGYEP
jgi:hypothetical protein